MHDTVWRGGAIASAFALLVAGPVAAAESRESRMAEVIAAKIELQRSLGEWLAGSLAKPAQPFRVDPVVQVVLRGEYRELQQQEEQLGGDVKIGGKSSMKLPGLGYADTGSGGTPEVILRSPGRRTTRTTRQLEMSVVKMVVRLYVDPAMPRDRRELLRTLASDLTGIEPGRGDELVVADLPAAAAAASVPVPVTTSAGTPALMSLPSAMPDRRFSALELALLSATAIAFAVILAFGLSRRPAGGAVAERDRDDDDAGMEIVDGRVIDIKGGTAHVGAADRSRESAAFPALADATAREVAEVLGDVDPAVAAAIVETRGLSDDVSRLFYVIVPRTRQLEIGLWLGKARVIARTELGQMETAAAAALARVRSRVTIGGASRLADFLSAAPDDVRGQLLDEVASRDAAMADAARGSMVVFSDLARLSDKSLRRVVTGIDPGVVALALSGAPEEVRSTLLGAVSKRLRGIIEGEAEAVIDRPAKDVEAARRVLERAMFQLHSRGELVPRAA